MSQSEHAQRKWIARLYDEATAAMEHGNWQEAAAKLDRVMDVAPDFPGAAYRQRQAHEWHQIDRRFEKARRMMNAARWSEALHLLRQVHKQAGNYRDAELLISVSAHQLLDAPPVPLRNTSWPAEGARAPLMAFAAVVTGFLLVLSASPFLFGNLEPNNSSVAQHVTSTTTPSALLAQNLTPAETAAAPDASSLPTEASSAPAPTEVAAPSASPSDSNPTASPARTTVSDPTARTIATRTPLPRATATRTPTSAGVKARTSTSTPLSIAASTTATPNGVSVAGGTAFPLLAPTATSTRALPTAIATPRLVSVAALDFEFQPANLIFNAGERLRITLINKGTVDHDWVLSNATGREVAKVLASVGQSASVTFNVPAAGIYDIACDIGDHAQLGMTGRATVR